MRQAEVEQLKPTLQGYSSAYQKVLLKEFFIKKVLVFLYTHSLYKDLVFTGGTCLRVLYDLPRLSEDIDLDVIGIDVDPQILRDDLETHVRVVGGYTDARVIVRSEGRSIQIKIPVLKSLGVVQNVRSESDLLFVKIDITVATNPHYQTMVTPYFKNGYSFVIKHYDLPSLFAGKATALFGRGDKLYHDKYSYKGRDFFDLIWYLQRGVVPHFKKLQYALAEIHIHVDSLQAYEQMLYEKIRTMNTGGIYEDIVDLIGDDISARSFADHYLQIYEGVRGVLERSE